jgi:hypothetical protein
MVAYFHRIGGTVGIYSMASQWDKIVKTIPSTSSLYRLADWIPGARTLAQAKANCRSVPLTGRGTVTVTQWTVSKTDHDFSCVK